MKASKPAAGMCSRCGRGARIADMKTSTRGSMEKAPHHRHNRFKWSTNEFQNRLSSLRGTRGHAYERGMSIWLATR
ncbi:unnamed protein product [Eruca vesicaria subsp. sativa]|uniref:Uncharacterized protein n=1 Tax=Eruca vesicaria subsp. sativa TaxID=29727 RepID=A0ABC8JM31_ERUVS|nr:unnamed protein product [Eruca vesicaria subsp. sativa]